MRKRVVGAVAAGVALALGVSGCVVFKGPVTAKQTGKREVTVSFKLCNSKDTGPRCPDLGNSDDAGIEDAQAPQEFVLLGLRVPKGVTAPARIVSSTPGVDGAFRPRADYARQLKRKAPTPRGFRWLGYAGSPLGDDGGPDETRYEAARFRVKFRLPRGFDGAFRVRPVVGWADDPPGDLECGPDPFEQFLDPSANATTCIDSPTRRKARTSIRVKIE